MRSDLSSMLRLSKIRLLLPLPVMLAALLPAYLVAQDDSSVDRNHVPAQAQAPNQTSDQAQEYDPNDAPLGDIARNLRKKSPPPQDVIDDDNLTKVMEQAESRRAAGSALKFLLAGASKELQAAAPDATCNLSFSANAKSLLSSSYAQMQLPLSEMSKLEGPATIEGDALIVALYNRTDWHVSEVSVALTVVKKFPASSSEASFSGGATLLPTAAVNASQQSEVRPEKKPDVTVIYRMRAAAAPSATTVFSAPLNLELAPDEEWHWAIVQARGYPPQSYAGNLSTAQNNGTAAALGQPISDQPITTPPPDGSGAASKNSPAVPPSQNPQ